MKRVVHGILLAALCFAHAALAAPPAGSLPRQWQTGAADCSAHPPAPLQVHEYRPGTYVIRQSLCADFEGPFMYLLVGDREALLIDTGAVGDARTMPLARTVLDLLPDQGTAKRPLLVVHTHSHSDHRAGDVQFAGMPSVRVAPTDPDGVRRFFGFDRWPDAAATLDLGGRTVDVIPTPGHHDTHLAYYDSATGLLFSGDFLLPGRLLIDDTAAYRESAARLDRLLRDRPVTHILGGHIERDTNGELFAHGSTHHPGERRLELSRDALTALPAALDAFNGFHAHHRDYVLVHPLHNLAALAAGALLVLVLAVWGVVRWWRRRKKRAA